MKIEEILSNFPLRISITDYCNLKCFFCSNEGMSLSQKNRKHADVNDLIYLIDILVKNGLKNISLTGGEPTLYKYLDQLINYVNQNEGINGRAIHTNGINLNSKMPF
mgnify:CR=1 FL=1